MPKNKKIETKIQISAGGIIYKPYRRDIRVCLVSRMGGDVWCLPKGIVEKGEKSADAARREVEEETGLNGRLVDKLGKITYWYYSKEDSVRYFKTVYFFLFRYTSGTTEDHDFEMDEARWFPVAEAIKKLSYKNEKDMMRKTKNLVRKRIKG